jgi:hypothetical protein
MAGSFEWPLLSNYYANNENNPHRSQAQNLIYSHCILQILFKEKTVKSFLITLAVLLSVTATICKADNLPAFQDGSVQLGSDSGFSGSSTIKIDGRAATLLVSGMYQAMQAGAKNITDSNGLTVGENFACREMPIKSMHYVCGAAFNKENKGEMKPLDPATFGN